MSTYAQVTGLRSGVLAAVQSVDDVGNVLTHYEPVKDRAQLLERYQVAEFSQARGCIVTPGSPFHTPSVVAVGTVGEQVTFRDTVRWDLTVFRGVQNDADQREEAIEMALAVFDALRAKYDFSAYGVELELAPDVRIQNHGYGPLSTIGCWITEIVAAYTFGQEFTVT